MMHKTLLSLLALAAGVSANAKPLVNGNGDKAAIPNWDFQSTSSVDKDLAKLSKTGLNTKSWNHVDASACTLMGCFLKNGKYKDSDLWFSDNLTKFNWGQFTVPWVYRNEFQLPKAGKGQHFFLETNGISSKADLYFNGKQIADAEFQAGAYGGHTYEITDLAAANNAFLVRVYPTQYLFDFAVGFVDWNPYSPDNGTGIWRDINIKQTGSVAMGTLSIAVDAPFPIGQKDATVTIRAKATNLEKTTVKLAAKATVSDPSGGAVGSSDQSITLAPNESKYVEFKQTVKNPKIWWPKEWGAQPLYSAKVDFSVNNAVSDTASSKFGIRTVTSVVNSHNDTMFTVNGQPFQVRGGGYGADMFLRWDSARFTKIVQYMFDIGYNTIRLEGKMEQPELYEIADKLGLFVIAGWECCDKWEAWDYNHDLALDPPPIWDERDYAIANASMVHEAGVLQTHPSMLSYFVGSDYWPNDRATKIYVDALKAAGWQVPIIASAAKRGFPALLGPSGMKMDGPYDWVPPNYWYDINGDGTNRYGSSFGFGSELGPGVGTPELGSLKKFLTKADMDDLWTNPDKGLYHMSNNDSQFYDRSGYNAALYARLGKPTSLDDYLMKAQLMDYEATRSEYEGYSSFWSAARPATGLIYWMQNNAWPSLHWNNWDYYFRTAGSYYGTKTGSRTEHVAYDYVTHEVHLINHSLDKKGARSIKVDVIDLTGKSLSSQTIATSTDPNTSKSVGKVSGLDTIKDVVFLRLTLTNQGGKTLSRNVYWLTQGVDALDWDNTTWWWTPVTKFIDYSALTKLQPATVVASIDASGCKPGVPGTKGKTVTLVNKSTVPAFFVSLNLVDASGADVVPVVWTDNYVTLWPGEKIKLTASQWADGAKAVEIKGYNVKAAKISI